MNVPDLDAPEALSVFADVLEERGDPRGALMRAQLAGDAARVAELLRVQGRAWLGSLVPEETLVSWKPGHVTEVALRKAAPFGLVRELVALPALRRVRRLALPSLPELSELGALEDLRELVLFSGRDDSWGSLAGVTLPALERLTLDVRSPRHLDALSTLHAPKLRFLDTSATPACEADFVRIVGGATWGQALEQWRHRPQSVEGLAALGVCWPLIAKSGRGLLALCSAPVLAQVTDGLRRALPAASFVERPLPERPSDPESSHHEASVTLAPLSAPTHFRSLPPRTERRVENAQNYDSPALEAEGSGVPLKAQLRGRFFSRCGWCGGDEQQCISESSWSMYSHFETTWFYRWEGECPLCRLFTHSGAMS